MTRFLLDTDTLSLLERGHLVVSQRIEAHPIGEVALPVISIQEQMQGALAALSQARGHEQLEKAYDRLVTRLLPAWGRFPVISLVKADMESFEQLRALRLNIGLMDLRIAAIALKNELTVVTRNRRDFGRVPGLRIEDWSV